MSVYTYIYIYMYREMVGISMRIVEEQASRNCGAWLHDRCVEPGVVSTASCWQDML